MNAEEVSSQRKSDRLLLSEHGRPVNCPSASHQPARFGIQKEEPIDVLRQDFV